MNQISITFIFLGIATVFLIGNILRPDIVALMLLLGLGLTGILTPREAFSGFSRSDEDRRRHPTGRSNSLWYQWKREFCFTRRIGFGYCLAHTTDERCRSSDNSSSHRY